MVLIVAIDGPAGAGKSTLGRALAARLGLEYLDTGAQYRSVAVAALRRGIDLDDPTALADLVATVDIVTDDGRVVIDGVDSTDEIRTPVASQAASKVAVVSVVRSGLASRQREWARVHGGGVIEGRDIGTVVFPDAQLKLFITASSAVRAHRRSQDTGESFAEVLESIRERDSRDTGREHAPLVTADGAIVVDTSDRPIDELVQEILTLVAGAS